MPTDTPKQIKLFFSSGELRVALKDLGAPGTLSEATVAVAAETLASVIEDTGEMYSWHVDIHGSAESARQSDRPHVVLSRQVLDPDWET